jgi:hypothetical protein
MSQQVNISGDTSTVYIDSGTYNYTFTTLYSSCVNPVCDWPVFFGYSSVTFNLTADFSSSVLLDDISTYPVILTNSTDETYEFVFLLYGNINAHFEYIKFVIRASVDCGRYLISCFFFFFFCFNFFNLFFSF